MFSHDINVQVSVYKLTVFQYFIYPHVTFIMFNTNQFTEGGKASIDCT